MCAQSNAGFGKQSKRKGPDNEVPSGAGMDNEEQMAAKKQKKRYGKKQK